MAGGIGVDEAVVGVRLEVEVHLVAQCSLPFASGAFTVVTLSLIWSDITGSPLTGTPG